MGLATGSHEQTKRTYPLVVGLATMQAWVVNPTKEQLIHMGVPAEQEPNYLFDYQGVKKRIVSIWLYGENNVLNTLSDKVTTEKLLAELKLYIPLKTGDTLIDKTGKYAKDKNKLHDQASARFAYPMEWKLNELLRCVGRVGYKEECCLNNIDALIQQGDVRELQAELDGCNNLGFKVRVALGVEDGQYQVVNSRAFAMDNQLSMKTIYEELAKGVEYEKKTFYGNFIDTSSALEVQQAIQLHTYHEEEALVQGDRWARRLVEKGSARPAMPLPAGAAPAGAAPAPSAPPAPGSAAAMSPAPGAAPGAAPAAPASPNSAAASPAPTTTAAPAPPAPGAAPLVREYAPPAAATEPQLNRQPVAAGDDDNDLPF